MTDRSPRHILAIARSVPLGGGCRCACCGPSPFGAAEPAKRRLRGNFTDWAWLADPAAPHICAGCVSLLAGRPGDIPPPARTRNILAIVGSPAEYPDRAECWSVLLDPPHRNPFVLVFGASRKRHAWLRAGVSNAHAVLVGTDSGTVTYRPRTDRPIVDATLRLLTGFGRATIATGQYRSSAVAAYGVADHARDEAIVSTARGPLLDLVCDLAPKQERRRRQSHGDLPLFAPTTITTTGDDVISSHDQEAARLLALLAQTCHMRGSDGQRFWSGFYRHRIERFRRLPLPDLVSRISDAIGCSPSAPAMQEAIALVARLDSEQQAAIEQAIRERPALCVALSFDLIDRSRS